MLTSKVAWVAKFLRRLSKTPFQSLLIFCHMLAWLRSSRVSSKWLVLLCWGRTCQLRLANLIPFKLETFQVTMPFLVTHAESAVRSDGVRILSCKTVVTLAAQGAHLLCVFHVFLRHYPKKGKFNCFAKSASGAIRRWCKQNSPSLWNSLTQNHSSWLNCIPCKNCDIPRICIKGVFLRLLTA